ncbi:S-formylglutathione hydrolase [Martiniozyma asiatica (nom. inval.)]|nr:S-formylglutathione hydrolase [Martiniozyma asiatica]
MSKFTLDATIKSCGGSLLKLSHASEVTKTPMNVNVYLPPNYSSDLKIPVLLYLSGLTCTPQNVSEKAFFQEKAAKYGFGLIFPDTSPRGANIEGEEESWDFGTGAGFYVDSIAEPWNKNYNMYSYILNELLPLVSTEYKGLDVENNCAITGHSMGGYGALMMYLRNKGKFTSCSAFAPICNPMECPWGQKCFGNYLGDDKSEWAKYDPCELIKTYQADENETILVHVGTADVFHYRDDQLKPKNLVAAAANSKITIDMNEVEGYDHSYYFISSFVSEHVDFHRKNFKSKL